MSIGSEGVEVAPFVCNNSHIFLIRERIIMMMMMMWWSSFYGFRTMLSVKVTKERADSTQFFVCPETRYICKQLLQTVRHLGQLTTLVYCWSISATFRFPGDLLVPNLQFSHSTLWIKQQPMTLCTKIMWYYTPHISTSIMVFSFRHWSVIIILLELRFVIF